MNFQVHELDLQAMGGAGDGTEKNFGPTPIIRPYMNPIHQGVWKKYGALIRCPKRYAWRYTWKDGQLLF